MTQTEKDMQELNMTPEKLAARQEQLAGITGAPRKTRSDAGKPREKKAPAVEGKLSQEQVIKLEALFAEREEAKIHYLDAQQVFSDFLDEITAK